MKINKLLLTAIIAISALSVSAQTRNTDLIQKKYPQIYSSIVKSSEQQWNNDLKIKQAVVEGQAQAFLNVLKLKESIDENTLRESIIESSLSGYKESNTKLLNEYSIDRAIPLLQCDWYKVQVSMKKNQDGTKHTTPARIINPTDEGQRRTSVPATVETKQQSDVYTERIQPQTNQSKVVTKENEQSQYAPRANSSQYIRQSDIQAPSKTKEYARYEHQRQLENEKYYISQNKNQNFSIGVKLGLGVAAMYDLGNYTNMTSSLGDKYKIPSTLQVKSVISTGAEGGIVFRLKTKGFFIENETAIRYMQAKFKNKTYTDYQVFKEGETYSNKYFNIQTGLHLGGYFEVGEGIELVAGVGPYISYKLSAKYDKYGIFGNSNATKDLYEEYMKAGEKDFIYGVSGVFGADIDNYRIALYPNIGLSKMQKEQNYKPFSINVGFTYFFK